jgi:hypothetical protein
VFQTDAAAGARSVMPKRAAASRMRALKASRLRFRACLYEASVSCGHADHQIARGLRARVDQPMPRAASQCDRCTGVQRLRNVVNDGLQFTFEHDQRFVFVIVMMHGRRAAGGRSHLEHTIGIRRLRTGHQDAREGSTEVVFDGVGDGVVVILGHDIAPKKSGLPDVRVN